MRRGTPSRSMFSIALGSAASEDVVANAISAGSFTIRMKARSGNPSQKRGRHQRHQDEHDQGAVERQHHLAQVDEHAHPAVAYRYRDRRANADRAQTSSRCR